MALRIFVEEAAIQLQGAIASGAEVPFELASKGARGRPTPLYCYEPLTELFIAQHASKLKGLASYEPAAAALEHFDGLDRYLRARDVNVTRADRRAHASAALRALLEDVFAQQTSFELRPERLEEALRGMEESVSAEAPALTLMATLHGLTIGSAELALAPGLLIARPEAIKGAPEGVLDPDEHHGGEHLLVAYSVEATEPALLDEDRGALAEGCEVLHELLRALRLFGDGRVTLGALGWARVGIGAWRPLALGIGGRPHGMLMVGAEQEDELRAFCNLVSRRRPRENELAWALERFELGCERSSEYEALSDYLLALRALLEPEGPSGGLLAGRLAALCATPEQRVQLSGRVLQALTLERAVIAGTAVEHAGGQALVRDLADHLRALLRDVICGHLDPNLVVLADELLLDDGPEAEVNDGLDSGTGPVVDSPDVEGDPWETDQLSLAGLPG
jgi:hypothetical protein